MGLDVNLAVINRELYRKKADEQNIDFILEYGLSRTFCNFLCRKDVVSHESELYQISKIVNVDITPIEKMDWYCDEYYMEDQLWLHDTEEEKNNFIQKTLVRNKQVIGNIDEVLETLQLLIEKLSKIQNLPSKLIKTNVDTLDNDWYFSEFNKDIGDGYIRNNFGQDLRNLLKQVEFAKKIGEETVYFDYG